VAGGKAIPPRSEARSGRARGECHMSLPLWTTTNDNGTGAIDPLAEIAHDLRQPIATLRALVASLQATEVSPDRLRWHLDNMEAQVDDLGDLVRASLGILVPDPAGEAEVDVRSLEVNTSVAATVRCFAVTWPGRIATCFGETAVVVAPPQMFRRSVRNVLDNAARAAGKQGAIVVSVVPSLTGTSIIIEDNGPGFGAIPAQHSIGLKIVHRTVSEAGGRLEITTSELLGGACVELFFPLVRDEVSIG
jgi:two-component system, OmpR family, sensor histidine kinase RstB